MTSIASLSAALPVSSPLRSSGAVATPIHTLPLALRTSKKRAASTVVAAVGDVSDAGTTYLIAGAAAVALLGTAFPILFSRKDLCPECDGAGFVRQSGVTLRANAARKDQTQIVCRRCNGLGKLGQVDK
ncbi:hypothetical protein Scep_005403 [Stephania cephalantha]|uniref:Uncharacterized protein n=1 Tax=Stephania cephalantha TaxID=152367 RepID=A0AAP0PY59_9MAGN